VVAQQASGLPAGLPRFTSLFNYGYRQPRRQHDGGRPILGIHEVSARGRTNYPLTMSVDDVGTGLVLTARVVAPGEAALVCGLLHTAVGSLVTALEQAPGTPLRQLPVLGAAQRAQLLQGWNDTAAAVPPGPVPELFLARAAAAPDAVAVACEGRRVSYGELAGRAARLARLLAGRGAGPETVVGICLERGPEVITAVVAAWLAGAAYLPLDPAYPAGRLEYMLADAGARLLVTSRGAADGLAGRLADGQRGGAGRVVWLDDPRVRQELAGLAPVPPPGRAAGGQLAYVIYTSGS